MKLRHVTFGSIAACCLLVVYWDISFADPQVLGPMKPFYDNLTALETRLATQNQVVEAQKFDRLRECIDGEVLQTKVRELRDKIVKGSVLSEDEQKILTSSSSVGLLEATVNEGWSVSMGTVAGLKMYSYDLAEKKASLADGLGIGTPIRFHGGNVHAIKQACRTRSYRMTTLDENPKTGTLGNHWFSITPTLYVSKNTNDSDIAIQPAIVLSFWNDILHFGTGFNLSGPNQGNVLLLFGVGTQLPGDSK